MFFSSEFIQMVEENPVGGVVDACKKAFERLSELEDDSDVWNEAEHELLWEVAAFIQLIIESNKLNFDHPLPEPSGDLSSNCLDLNKYLQAVVSAFEGHSTKLKIESYKNRYQTALKASFAYEFSQGDYDRVQMLVNELRQHIAESVNLAPEHKRRLLKRLEHLQSELHKRVSDLDRFWGLVGDAGVVLGKLGKDAKPIVDRVREIAAIVWQTQARTEELSSNASNPMLEQKENT